MKLPFIYIYENFIQYNLCNIIKQITEIWNVLSTHIVDSSCKKPLVICNSIFSIFLNQIKAQKGQKIIVWIEYFPYKYLQF
jgi:hypothetical protein